LQAGNFQSTSGREQENFTQRRTVEMHTLVTESTEAAATYGDGQALDRVQYLECKIILKPDRFVSVDSFRQFGKIVERTARKLEVEYVSCLNGNTRPQVREIVFGDTPTFSLYNHSFILRRRIRYEDGFPVGDPEIVFKFRHPDLQTAAAVDVRPQIAGRYRVKFKVEALPLREEVGGFRLLYSHNCVFGLSQMHDSNKTSMQTLARVFPALAALDVTENECVALVSEAIVEEVLLDLGTLRFGKGIAADCNVALWRTRGEHKPLIGEFAFQAKFDPNQPLHKKVKKLCEQFFVSLQFEVCDWISLGTTKTGVVYRLKGNLAQPNE
jgi:hypothetical protein